MPDVTTGFARTDDGQELYYRVLGDHGPVLVCCNGIGVSTFFWKYVALAFRDWCRVVLWDYRGHGRSTVPRDPDHTDLSMERNAKDLFTVLDALHVDEPVVLLGHSMGCQVILEAHKQHPERIRALIPMFGTYGRAMDTFMDYGRSRQIFDWVNRIARLGGRSSFRFLLPLYASPIAFAFSRMTGMVDRYYAARVDMDHYMDHLEHIQPRVFLAMLDRMANHDLEDHLPDIRVPTLVFGGEYDLFTPLRCSKHMAASIPDAELTILAEGSHAAIVEHPETINLRLARFLDERLDLRPPTVAHGADAATG
ncbi:MAG: alpha/beta hydrolase [Alphaproteobacteria bacterium]|nr:alpha/beta hydrolase [Alphaproteobacteria bacterium]